jgi:hypothetical protein
MKNDPLKQMSERLKNAQSEVPPFVWDEIEHQLPQTKKRKLFIWYSVAAIVLFVSATALILINSYDGFHINRYESKALSSLNQKKASSQSSESSHSSQSVTDKESINEKNESHYISTKYDSDLRLETKKSNADAHAMPTAIQQIHPQFIDIAQVQSNPVELRSIIISDANSSVDFLPQERPKIDFNSQNDEEQETDQQSDEIAPTRRRIFRLGFNKIKFTASISTHTTQE